MSKTTFYVQVEPVWSSLLRNGQPVVRTIKPARMTARRPDPPKGGTVTVKLTLDIPDSAFSPLSPEAIIVVPEGMTLATPIEVVAEDPNE